ncbi:MAG: hypothetical protein RR415_12595, partial [Ruthenibacterium sp.]
FSGFSYGDERVTRRSHSYSRRMARLAATHNIKEDGGTVALPQRHKFYGTSAERSRPFPTGH